MNKPLSEKELKEFEADAKWLIDTTIDDTTTSIIESLTIDGLVVRPPAHILPDAIFKELSKRMKKIGGVWKTNKKGWLFKTDPTSFITELKAGKKVDIYQDFQFFFTPDEVLEFITHWPEIDLELEWPSPTQDFRFCDPSAGEGHIIRWFTKKFISGEELPERIRIDACEIMPRNRELLEKLPGVNIIANDFLTLSWKYDSIYDLIIANPPFSENQYIKHIYRMYDLIKEGGTLITVAPNNFEDSNDPERIEFRDWLKTTHANVKPIPPKLFKKNKAGAKTVAIWIDILYS